MASPASRNQDNQIEVQLAALETMEVEPLRSEWLRLYRTAAPPRLSKDLLTRGVAHKLQEAAFGGLRPAARRALASMVNDAGTGKGAEPVPVALRPGAMLVRSWKGQTHTVQVLTDGFEHNGRAYRSLSQIAKIITGAHWSGPRFFGLTSASSSEPNREAA